MTKLTTKRLEKLARGIDGFCAAIASYEEPQDMARQLLAYEQAAKNPVAYRNKFTGQFFTLEQQPNAATDVEVYEPVFLAAPILPKQPDGTLTDEGTTAAPAQPVIPERQAVQLAPHIYRELVNDLRDVALEYHGAEQLRERISRTLSKALTAAHSHLSQPVQEMTYMMATERGIKTSNREQWIKGYNAAINDGMLLSPAQPVNEPSNSPVIPDGWKLVPIEPTAEMAQAARDCHEGESFLPYSIYRAMLAAAPAPAQEQK